MAEPNLTCRWDELQVGDRVITKDGVFMFTIASPPFVNEDRLGYKVTGASAVRVVEHTNREREVTVRRPSLG